MSIKNNIKNNWLNLLQFLLVLLTTFGARLKLPSTPDIIDWCIICFLIALFISGIYEIPIKTGMKQGTATTRILRQVMMVWIMPMILGYLIAGFTF